MSKIERVFEFALYWLMERIGLYQPPENLGESEDSPLFPNDRPPPQITP